MHMLGDDPRTMQHDPRYDDVVAEVKAFLEERLAFAVREGVPEEHVWLDPGIGFGKTVEHNLELIRRLDEIVAIGRPLVIGTSRKTFLGRITGRSEPERAVATCAANVMAYERGARIFRVHDVAANVDALQVAAATVGSPWAPKMDGEQPAEDPDELDEEPSADEDAPESVTIEITGLSLYTHHGVEEAEREVGQRLVFDLSFELGDCDAVVTDRLEDTIDYADVCQQVALAAQERSYKTLERLCSAIADRMIERYGAESVTVRAAKPEPPIALPIEEVAVEIWKEGA